MKSLARTMAVLSALIVAAQPCLAASGTQSAHTPQVKLAPVSYSLSQPGLASAGSVSMTHAASIQTASEAVEQKRERRGPSTALIIGGGVLLVALLLVVAVAASPPPPGPAEGVFN